MVCARLQVPQTALRVGDRAALALNRRRNLLHLRAQPLRALLCTGQTGRVSEHLRMAVKTQQAPSVEQWLLGTVWACSCGMQAELWTCSSAVKLLLSTGECLLMLHASTRSETDDQDTTPTASPQHVERNPQPTSTMRPRRAWLSCSAAASANFSASTSSDSRLALCFSACPCSEVHKHHGLAAAQHPSVMLVVVAEVPCCQAPPVLLPSCLTVFSTSSFCTALALCMQPTQLLFLRDCAAHAQSLGCTQGVKLVYASPRR